MIDLTIPHQALGRQLERPGKGDGRDEAERQHDDHGPDGGIADTKHREQGFHDLDQ